MKISLCANVTVSNLRPSLMFKCLNHNKGSKSAAHWANNTWGSHPRIPPISITQWPALVRQNHVTFYCLSLINTHTHTQGVNCYVSWCMKLQYFLLLSILCVIQFTSKSNIAIHCHASSLLYKIYIQDFYITLLANRDV